MSSAPLAIVLAAGAGRRMGIPKASLVTGGRSLLDHHALRLAELGCHRIALVVPPAIAAALGDRPRAAGAFLVPVVSQSPAESLAAGIQALAIAREPGEVVVVTPVDLLPPGAPTLEKLLGALLDHDCDPSALAATPTYRGRGGHPVVVRRAVLAEHLSAPTPPPLRDILRRIEREGGRRRIEVTDPRILGDLDTPADLAAHA